MQNQLNCINRNSNQINSFKSFNLLQDKAPIDFLKLISPKLGFELTEEVPRSSILILFNLQ